MRCLRYGPKVRYSRWIQKPWRRSGESGGALFARDGCRILAIKDREDRSFGARREQLAWAQLDVIKVVARLLVDRSHNSNIDYEALQASMY